VKSKNTTYTPKTSEYTTEWTKEYRMFQTNIESSTGRGILLYVHESLYAEETKMQTQFEENVFVKIKTSNADNMIVENSSKKQQMTDILTVFSWGTLITRISTGT
jgi:hypothetical protein